MRLYLSIAACLLAIAACSDITVPEEDPTEVGLIVERDVPTSFAKDRPTIWVKETEEAECGVIFVISDETELIRRDRFRRLQPIDASALKIGSVVRVWSDIVLLSCPGQATAKRVELVTGP